MTFEEWFKQYDVESNNKEYEPFRNDMKSAWNAALDRAELIVLRERVKS